MAEQFANRAQTTLAAGANDSQLTITVANGAVFPAAGTFRVLVDTELMICTARTGNVLTVTRGAESTVAAAHGINAQVTSVLTAAVMAKVPLTDQLNTFSAIQTFTPGIKIGTTPYTVAEAGGSLVVTGGSLKLPGDFDVVYTPTIESHRTRLDLGPVAEHNSLTIYGTGAVGGSRTSVADTSGGGRITFGSAEDTDLYRLGAGQLASKATNFTLSANQPGPVVDGQFIVGGGGIGGSYSFRVNSGNFQLDEAGVRSVLTYNRTTQTTTIPFAQGTPSFRFRDTTSGNDATFAFTAPVGSGADLHINAGRLYLDPFAIRLNRIEHQNATGDTFEGFAASAGFGFDLHFGGNVAVGNTAYRQATLTVKPRGGLPTDGSITAFHAAQFFPANNVAVFRAAATPSVDIVRVEDSGGNALVSIGSTGSLTVDPQGFFGKVVLMADNYYSNFHGPTSDEIRAQIGGDSNRPVLQLRASAGQTVNPFEVQISTSTGPGSRVQVAIDKDGKLQFGDVAATTTFDTNLYRSAANTLKTDDTLEVATDIKVGPSGLLLSGAGTRLEAQYVTYLGNTGPYAFWDSSAVNIVNRDSALNVPLKVQGMAAQSGDLQRWQDSGGNILLRVQASGNIRQIALGYGGLFETVTSGDTFTRFSADTNGHLDWGSGSAVQDTNLYRWGANILATDDKLQVAVGTAAAPQEIALFRNADTSVGAAFVNAGNEAQLAFSWTGDGIRRVLVGVNAANGQDGIGWYNPATQLVDTGLYRGAVDTLKTNDILQIVPNINTGTSTSTGGALLVENTASNGAGIVAYSNHATPTGRLVSMEYANALGGQTVLRVAQAGTTHGATIDSTSTGANANALVVTSTNPNDTTLGVSGAEEGKGTIKVTHNKPTNPDTNASAISIQLAGASTAAQGIFMDSTGATTGKLLNLRNNGADRLVLSDIGLLSIDAAGAASNTVGLRFGGEVNATLYRSAASVIRTDGTLAAATLRANTDVVNNSSANNARLRLLTTGVTLDKNLADANTVLTVQDVHASGTGNLADFKDNTAVLFSVTHAGLPRWVAAASQQTTVGAAGGASALPATPTKYLKVVDSAGTTLVVPAYAAA